MLLDFDYGRFFLENPSFLKIQSCPKYCALFACFRFSFSLENAYSSFPSSVTKENRGGKSMVTSGRSMSDERARMNACFVARRRTVRGIHKAERSDTRCIKLTTIKSPLFNAHSRAVRL